HTDGLAGGADRVDEGHRLRHPAARRAEGQRRSSRADPPGSTMRRPRIDGLEVGMYRIFCFVALAMVLVGCSAAPRTAAAPEPAAASQPVQTSEWDGIVAAAKREGKVVIMGPQGTDGRDVLVDAFQRKYPDIQVDYSGMSGEQVQPKLMNEMAANQHLTDLLVKGTTVMDSVHQEDAVVPIPPFLVGPNTRDPTVWRNGDFNFSDAARQYSLMFSAYKKESFVYNPALVAPGEIT